MQINEIKDAINSGYLYATFVMEDGAYVYFDSDGVEDEHCAYFMKTDGVWVLENKIYGDLSEAVGGESSEKVMLGMIGLVDDDYMGTPNKSLRTLLEERQDHYTLTATLGTNGNGGMASPIAYILEADDKEYCRSLDLHEITPFRTGELIQHMGDDGMEIEENDKWVAFDYTEVDSQGYLTGSISRIYVNLSV